MSMRDKYERDWFRDTNADFVVRSIHKDSLNELLDIADERDDLMEKLKQEERITTGWQVRVEALQAELTQEQNATQEWRVIAEGMEKEVKFLNENIIELDRRWSNALGEKQELEEELALLKVELKINQETCIKACNFAAELEKKLERLQNSVPDDVEGAIDLYEKEICRYELTPCGDKSKERQKERLIILIGSLIERKREDLEEAYVHAIMLREKDFTAIPPESVTKAAKAYADRKMKEGE